MNRRTSSISPASMNEPARRGPPSSRMLVTGGSRAPSWSSAEQTRAGLVLAGGDDDVGARRSRARRSRCAGRRARRRRRAGPRAPRRRASSRAAAARSSRTRRAAAGGGRRDPRRELRVVGERGADPDGDGVERRAPAVRDGAAALARDPLRVAALGRDLAVEAHRRLEDDQRAAGAGVLAEGLVLQPGAGGELAAGDVDLDALVAEDARGRGRRPSSSGRRRRRRRGAGPRARIASVHGGWWPWWQQGSSETYSVAPCEVGAAAVGDRVDLGVRPAVLVVPALAEHGAVADDDGADDRVGGARPQPPLGEVDRPRQVRWSLSVPLHASRDTRWPIAPSGPGRAGAHGPPWSR